MFCAQHVRQGFRTIIFEEVFKTNGDSLVGDSLETVTTRGNEPTP